MKRLILFIFPLLTVLGFSAHDNKEAEEKIKKEIRVISNGVNINIFKKSEELKKKFLTKYKINKPLIITAGLPFERKGIKDFVKLVERCSDYQFLWFGSSSIKSMLPKKIQKIIENAYNIAKERDLKNVGLQYKNYYEYILGK